MKLHVGAGNRPEPGSASLPNSSKEHFATASGSALTPGAIRLADLTAILAMNALCDALHDTFEPHTAQRVSWAFSSPKTFRLSSPLVICSLLRSMPSCVRT